MVGIVSWRTAVERMAGNAGAHRVGACQICQSVGWAGWICYNRWIKTDDGFFPPQIFSLPLDGQQIVFFTMDRTMVFYIIFIEK